jgi:predicted Zn-ribbon and HTH transcriptional regulator
MIEKLKCLSCGYTWIPRIETRPKMCPGCKNRKWDESTKKA